MRFLYNLRANQTLHDLKKKLGTPHNIFQKNSYEY